MALHRGSIFSLVTTLVIHEGDQSIIHRQDGSSEVTSYEEQEVEFAIALPDIQTKGLAAIEEAIVPALRQFQETTEQKILTELQEAAKEGEAAVNAGGKPFTAELYLEVLEGMESFFDDEGNWVPPTPVFPIPMLKNESVQHELERLVNDPDIRQKLEHLVESKKEEWRVREANRKPVD